MRCNACRRPISNPTSIRYGLGPDCLKRAVKAGTAPIEALTELAEEKKKQPKRTKAAPQLNHTCTKTPDLFEKLRNSAIAMLEAAADECRSFGVEVTIEIRKDK